MLVYAQGHKVVSLVTPCLDQNIFSQFVSFMQKVFQSYGQQTLTVKSNSQQELSNFHAAAQASTPLQVRMFHTYEERFFTPFVG
jgi:DNA-binding LacI/PurR family transcriptional regulator